MAPESSSTTPQRLILYVPDMHPALIPESAPAMVRRFDPGLPAKSASGRAAYSPPDLPLSPQEARRYGNEMLDFGRNFRKPGDLAFYAVRGFEDFYTGTALDQHSEFAALGEFAQSGVAAKTPSPPDASEADLRVRLKAQRILLLACLLEDKRIETRRLEAGLGGAQDRFEAALGLGEEQDPEMEAMQETAQLLAPKPDLPEQEAPGQAPLQGAPWRVAIENMLLFCPPQTVLFTMDQGLRAAWDEMGIEFTSLAASGIDPDLPDEAEAAPAEGWRLLGYDRLPADKPWLAARVTALFLPTA